jgi:hypothetical protein
VGDPDGAHAQPHQALLMREDMLDHGADESIEETKLSRGRSRGSRAKVNHIRRRSA